MRLSFTHTVNVIRRGHARSTVDAAGRGSELCAAPSAPAKRSKMSGISYFEGGDSRYSLPWCLIDVVLPASTWLVLAILTLITACQPATETPPSLAWQSDDDQHYTLHWANVSMTVDAQTGGRIVSLQVQGEELLTDSAVHPLYYGSTLWLSPQHRWWPPPPILETDPYRVVSTANPLTLLSRADEELGLQLRKTFRAEPADSSLRITYTVINRADTAQSVALWEVTRLPKDAEVNFVLDAAAGRNQPFRKHTAWSVKDGQFHLRVVAGDTTVDKASYNARGWVHYTRGERQLRKHFADLSLEQLPPRQNEVEVYIDDSAYLEVEQHSAYQTLPPQDSLVWTVRWYPR